MRLYLAHKGKKHHDKKEMDLSGVAQILEGEHEEGIVIEALGKTYTLIPLIPEKEFEEIEGKIRTLANSVEIVLTDGVDKETRFKLRKLGFENSVAVLSPRSPEDLSESILKLGFAMYPKEAVFFSIYGHKLSIPNLSHGELRFGVQYRLYDVFDTRDFFEKAFSIARRWVEKWRTYSGLKSLQ